MSAARLIPEHRHSAPAAADSSSRGNCERNPHGVEFRIYYGDGTDIRHTQLRKHTDQVRQRALNYRQGLLNTGDFARSLEEARP